MKRICGTWVIMSGFGSSVEFTKMVVNDLISGASSRTRVRQAYISEGLSLSWSTLSSTSTSGFDSCGYCAASSISWSVEKSVNVFSDYVKGCVSVNNGSWQTLFESSKASRCSNLFDVDNRHIIVFWYIFQQVAGLD